ncbi:MAG: aldehyde dehydrogenase family protein [Lysinibacillus sp.]
MLQTTASEMKVIFDKQNAYQWTVRQSTAAERVQKLTALRDAIVANSQAIIQAAQQDYDRPAEDEQNQIHAVVFSINHAIDNVAKWMEPEEVPSQPGSRAQIIYEPKGVVCIMGTWNSPLATNIHPLAEAIAAGNCVMIKPSELTPHYSQVLKDILLNIFDEQEVAVVLGDAKVAEELLTYPFNHFFFTGSPRVGKIVMAGAAKHLAGVTLELGGKSPAILDKGTNLQQAAQQLAYGKVLMGGQFCICPDYIFVHEDDVASFVATYDAIVKAMLYDENGNIRNTGRTAVVNDIHYNRLKNLFDDAVAKGATVLSGGTFNDELRLIEPTILGNITDEMLIVEEEIFGPLTFIRTYTEIEAVIQYISVRPKPLALYIFSEDEAFQQHVLHSTASGGVTINGIVMHNTHPELPFGGINNSGLGSFHGSHGFKTFSHARAVYTVLPS